MALDRALVSGGGDGVAEAGCATAPRQPDSDGAGSTTRSRRRTDQAAVSGTRTDFHEKATERQRFQVHIDFGLASRPRGILMRRSRSIKTPSRSSRAKGGGRSRGHAALAHRRMGSAFDRTGRFAQAETHYQKALNLSPQGSQDLERRGI